MMSKEMREFSLFHNLQLIDTHPRFRELLAGNTPRSKYFCGDINSHPTRREMPRSRPSWPRSSNRIEEGSLDLSPDQSLAPRQCTA